MDDEEFRRIKEAEKKHLRKKKRLQRTLKALKRRNEVQGVLQRMRRGATRLLDETESLIDSLRRTVAQSEARFEVALDDEQIEDEDLHETEEELREKRAEALVRRMKAEEEALSRPRPSIDDTDDSSDTEDSDEPEREGPDKTIGRMGDLCSDDAS